MTHYVYAPKDDPLHRERWREPYAAEALDGFERLVASGTLEVGFGISPGLSIDYESADDRAALRAKVDQVVDVGVGLVALAARRHPACGPGWATTTPRSPTWLRDHLGGRADARADADRVHRHRCDALPRRAAPRACPTTCPIGWTGPTGRVRRDHRRPTPRPGPTRSAGGAPLLWDNYPVNDAVMADRLFLGPLRGREPGLAEVCSGYVANPMVQPMASKLPLASIAGLLRGDDPTSAWARTPSLGCASSPRRATACGPVTWSTRCGPTVGRRPRAARSTRLDAWLDDAAELAHGLRGWRSEVEPWLDQAHAERRSVARRRCGCSAPGRSRRGADRGRPSRGMGLAVPVARRPCGGRGVGHGPAVQLPAGARPRPTTGRGATEPRLVHDRPQRHRPSGAARARPSSTGRSTRRRQGSRAARKKSREVLEAGLEHLLGERVATEQPLDEGQVAEVAQEGAVAGEQELLGIELAEVARRPSRARSRRRPARSRGRSATPRSTPRRAVAVEGLAADDADEVRVLPEELEAGGEHLVDLAPALASCGRPRWRSSTRPIHSTRARLEDLLVDGLLRREVVQHARPADARPPRRCR